MCHKFWFTWTGNCWLLIWCYKNWGEKRVENRAFHPGWVDVWGELGSWLLQYNRWLQMMLPAQHQYQEHFGLFFVHQSHNFTSIFLAFTMLILHSALAFASLYLHRNTHKIGIQFSAYTTGVEQHSDASGPQFTLFGLLCLPLRGTPHPLNVPRCSSANC